MNGSAGSQRTLPRALALALLVGGSGGLVAQGHQARADVGDVPGHQRVDLDAEPTADTLPASPPSASPLSASPLAASLLAPYLPASNPLAARPLARPLAAVPAVPSVQSLQSLQSLRVPAPLPVGVPGLAAVSAVPPEAAPAHPAGSGRHAARSRPADSGRSAHRRPDEHRAHSHRRDLPATPHATGELNWTALARCEAGGNPRAVDPSGRYGGLYQFDTRTWRGLGGRGLPQDASAGEQTDRARELYQQRGLSPWPACGPRAAG